MVERAPEVFSGVAEYYDAVRPSYPAGLYRVVSEELRIGPESSVLEVGAGSGAATAQIVEAWNPRITALEPGTELRGILEERFRGNPKVEIEGVKFEAFEPKRKYDFLFSATAFHWVDRKMKFRLAFDALGEGGGLVLYWNNYSRDDDPVFDEIQAVYRKYYPVRTYNKDIRIVQRKSIEDRRKEVERSGLFRLRRCEEFVERRTFAAAEYVKLLRTFSKNAARSEEIMKTFYGKMEELILSKGDRLELPVHTDLIIAKKILPQDGTVLKENPWTNRTGSTLFSGTAEA